MNRIVTMMAAALVLLAGCNRHENADATHNEAAGVADAGKAADNGPAASAAAATDPGKNGAAAVATADTGVNNRWLVGRWTDNGDCKGAIELLDGGVFRNDDGSQGQWALDDNRLVLSANGNQIAMIVERTNSDVMTLTYNDGSIGRSTRC